MKLLSKISILMLIASIAFSCKNDAQPNSETIGKTTIPETSKRERKENTRKTANVSVEATVNGENFSLTNYNPEKSTDVVYQNNAAQFRIADFEGQSVLINLQSPEMFNQKPISIRQQTVALPIKEVHGTKEQSKLTVEFKSDEPAKPKIYELYDGELAVEKFSDTKIVITFDGRGSVWGKPNKEANLFPMQGKIELENFTINDFRMEEE